jgi:hypothetical protein
MHIYNNTSYEMFVNVCVLPDITSYEMLVNFCVMPDITSYGMLVDVCVSPKSQVFSAFTPPPFSFLFLSSAINCIQDYYYLILSLYIQIHTVPVSIKTCCLGWPISPSFLYRFLFISSNLLSSC